MERKKFIHIIMGTSAFVGLGSLSSLIQKDTKTAKMPVLFIGHGSPMNAVEQNIYSKTWQEVANQLEKPKAIVCISAHWLTKGSFVTAVENPTTIHDFGGFPDELFQVQYPAKGEPTLAKEIINLFPKDLMHLDMEWGLDHGTWSVLKHMYPLADVPTLQISIDYSKSAAYHFELASYLKKLREHGVLIVGSGNMVHHLGLVAWDKLNVPNYGYDWAIEMNSIFKNSIEKRDFQALINYQQLSSAAKLAIPTPDHYFPLLYVLGLTDTNEKMEFFNDYLLGGSLSMTSVKFG
jgi:4,5-DOPA dioxygenase extradiol